VIALLPPRDELYRVCDQRFLDMLAAGALDEVRALAAHVEAEALALDLPVFKALGYAPLAAHLRGETSLDDAIATSQQQTRNYAKRQYTWFRNQLPGADACLVLKLSYPNLKEIFSFLS
jgi:tRNA dimethylallyltransferase